jgi:ABC-type oligopeptide transport system substrate-binding subunit
MRKTLFAVLAFVLALLILAAACSPKDKPADDRKKPQESNSTMPDDPQKPGEPIFFYQVISRERREAPYGFCLSCG